MPFEIVGMSTDHFILSSVPPLSLREGLGSLAGGLILPQLAAKLFPLAFISSAHPLSSLPTGSARSRPVSLFFSSGAGKIKSEPLGCGREEEAASAHVGWRQRMGLRAGTSGIPAGVTLPFLEQTGQGSEEGQAGKERGRAASTFIVLPHSAL